MPLSAEEQSLFDHARNALPRWLTTGKTAVLEWIYAFVAIFEAVRVLANEYLEGVFLNTATGRWLDQHARDHDTIRLVGETDADLRARIRLADDAVTDPALQAGVNAILGVSITIAAPGTITLYDAVNGATGTVTLAATTYTFEALTTLVRAALPAGWSFAFINARARFNATNATTSATVPFDVTFSSVGIRNSFGFAANASAWVVGTSGYYESTTLIPSACGIIHLRRQRGHFQTTTRTAFLNRGYRMTNAAQPMTYVVQLPLLAAAPAKIAVEEYLRLFGPAGFLYLVETVMSGTVAQTLDTLTVTATGVTSRRGESAKILETLTVVSTGTVV